MGNMEVAFLRKRVGELEEKVEQLRLSRRVLMNLIEKLEQERDIIIEQFEKENKKLHVNNWKYARSLLQKNRQIVELERELTRLSCK